MTVLYPEKFFVKVEKKIARSSPDHLMPWGTRRDNHRHYRFNEKLYQLFGFPNKKFDLFVLDLGCAGGGFVKSCIDDGCFSLGIEGSDYSRKMQRAEWNIIPNFLFTGDITGNFDILDQNKKRLKFDVITCWEVMEHLKETEIAAVIKNVRKHLKSSGLWFISITSIQDIVHGYRLHQTVKPKEWWIKKFSSFGFQNLTEHLSYFRGNFVRPAKKGIINQFYLILSYSPKDAPTIPREVLIDRLLDRWYVSRPYRVLRKLIVNEK